MTPIADVRTDGGASLVDLHRHATRQEMRSCGQTDRTTANHGDCEGFQSSTLSIFRPSGTIEITNQKRDALGSNLSWARGASGVDATLVD